MNESDLPLALFTSTDGKTRIEIRLQDDSLWLTQRQIAALYEKSPPTVNEQLKNIYEAGELTPEATIRKYRTVAREGSRDVERLLDHYNLEAVLAVGYRVNSTHVARPCSESFIPHNVYFYSTADLGKAA